MTTQPNNKQNSAKKFKHCKSGNKARNTITGCWNDTYFLRTVHGSKTQSHKSFYTNAYRDILPVLLIQRLSRTSNSSIPG